jgi:hypothetical protein
MKKLKVSKLVRQEADLKDQINCMHRLLILQKLRLH